MKSIEIVNDGKMFTTWVGDLTDVMDAESHGTRDYEVLCPRCGGTVRFRKALVVSSRDMEEFRLMLVSACQIMEKYNITGNLLADIKMQLVINTIQRRISRK